MELQRAFLTIPEKVWTTEVLANRIDVADRTVRKYLKELRDSELLPTDSVRVSALNDLDHWGPSDHCRVEIEVG